MAVYSGNVKPPPTAASFSIIRTKQPDCFPVFTNQTMTASNRNPSAPRTGPGPISQYNSADDDYHPNPATMTMVLGNNVAANREMARSPSQNGLTYEYFSIPASPSPTGSNRSATDRERLERNIERWETERTTRRNVYPAGNGTSLQGGIRTPQKISDIRTAYSRSTPTIGPVSLPAPGTKKKQLERSVFEKEAEVNALTNLMVTKMNIPLDPNSYGLCTKCLRSVRFEEEGCTALESLYHTRCFCCEKCGKALRGSSFYVIDGKAMCEADYMDSLEKCAACKKPITERILRATGKPFHPKCFVCVACKQCLDGIPFTVDANNQIHCIDDFHRKFAPRCSVCSDPIVPEQGQEETVRIVCMDRNFHPKCYRCVDCKTTLSSEEEGRGCYPMDGQVLCHNCNIKRVQALNY
ncbi:lipoma-preferred partner homolog [Paramacrobiotus metropolitanus]|uniref:lipoma-preferred partner homolog n=1 Tax=Paramacrobiotus metropolitanus TaxID=2943436 RepID=UPI002445E566|nr:lipoma-preferred partner homolog [Paramacrobiotus metropolitanus]